MDPKVETALQKIVKGTNPGSLAVMTAALAELGITVQVVKGASGKSKRIELTVPGVLADSPEGTAVWTYDLAGYKKFDGGMLMAFSTYGRESSAPKVGYGDPDYKKNEEQNHSMAVLTRQTLVNRARKALPNAPEPWNEGLLGPKPEPVTWERGSCPVCFRSIAKHEATRLIVDHGYTAPGRGTGSVHKQGSCFGHGYRAYDESCAGTEDHLERLEQYAAQQLEAYNAELIVPRESFTEVRRKVGGNHELVKCAKGTTEYHRLRHRWLAEMKARLQGLWSGSYSSIPWYRNAVAAWTPGAVGPQESWRVKDHTHAAFDGRPELA